MARAELFFFGRGIQTKVTASLAKGKRGFSNVLHADKVNGVIIGKQSLIDDDYRLPVNRLRNNH
jgi:hypothetical protein